MHLTSLQKKTFMRVSLFGLEAIFDTFSWASVASYSLVPVVPSSIEPSIECALALPDDAGHAPQGRVRPLLLYSSHWS
jgi:hypothetical protein